MSSIRKADGTLLDKTALTALLTENVVPPTYTVDENVYRLFRTAGAQGSDHESQRELLWHAGQVVTTKELNDLFQTATVSSITPVTGDAAGGTVVTIKGQNLGGVSAVTFGAAAGEDMDVVDDNTVVVTTPANTAGAYDVIVSDDSGDVTVTDGFTYA